MGLFNNSDSDNKEVKGGETKVSEKDDTVTVRSSTVNVDKDSDKGGHETVFSRTDYDTKTGESKHIEGYHGTKENKK